ncbi:MAG TPA: hypothetical protein VIX80_06930 [Candidatus Kapabacteria bacterium]
MKKPSLLFALFAVILFVHSAFAGEEAAKKQMNERLSSLKTVDKTLENLVIQAPPKQSSKSELEKWRSQTQWFSVTRKRLSDYQSDLVKTKQGETLEMHMMKMNEQFLALKEGTMVESRKFQTLSNASKSRHDIALNAIRNMK